MTGGGLNRWVPRPGEWNHSTVSHFFRRTGFGGRTHEIETAVERGLDWALAFVFEDGAVEEPVGPLLSLLDLGLLQAWWMERLRDGPSLRERMALTWHGHFATSHEKVGDVAMMHRQNDLFRSRGLGDFRILLRAVARDPAMITWLDGASNHVEHPNENFARELMELFSLGGGAYGEGDVLEAARAFTGWGLERGRFSFRSSLHDHGSKTVLGRTGSWDGDEVIDLILDHPACSRHIARRLLTTFVAPLPEPAWIEDLAQLLTALDWHIGRVLEVLLVSELFFSREARRSRIAAPVELLTSVSRLLEVHPSSTGLATAAARMGQSLFCPPSVEGWKEGRSWIDIGRWAARHNALVWLVDEAMIDRLESNVFSCAWPEATEALFGECRYWNPRRDAARLLTSPEGQMY